MYRSFKNVRLFLTPIKVLYNRAIDTAVKAKLLLEDIDRGVKRKIVFVDEETPFGKNAAKPEVIDLTGEDGAARTKQVKITSYMEQPPSKKVKLECSEELSSESLEDDNSSDSSSSDERVFKVYNVDPNTIGVAYSIGNVDFNTTFDTQVGIFEIQTRLAKFLGKYWEPTCAQGKCTINWLVARLRSLAFVWRLSSLRRKLMAFIKLCVQ